MVRRLLFVLGAALGVLAASGSPAATANNSDAFTWRAHFQSSGWTSAVGSDVILGRPGSGKRLEAVQVISGPLLSGRAHVQRRGWVPADDWTLTPPAVIGTTGHALRLEAVRLLVSDPAVTIECAAYVQGRGWLPTVRDGDTCGTTGQARRVEAIRLRVAPRPAVTPSPTPTVTTPPTGAESIALTADVGMESPGKAVLASIGASPVAWAAIMGDLAYSPDAKGFCDQTNARVRQPVALIPGNHETPKEGGDPATHSDWTRYLKADCLPDRLGVTGSYAAGEWYVDRGPLRFIAMSPRMQLPTGTRTYARGTPERERVKTWIDQARAAGKWVVVGMHQPCLTLGSHGCSHDPSITDMLIGKRVDLIVAGHDHVYARTHQLATANTTADRDNDYRSGAGTVNAVVGNGGHKPRAAKAATGIWAKGSAGSSYGWVRLDATDTTLTYTYQSVGGPALADRFAIRR